MTTTRRSSSRRMGKLRAAFYQEGKALSLSADPTQQALSNCWVCGMAIDYDTPPNTTPASHNLDHYFAVSTHPEFQEDPSNFRHSHDLCNKSRGSKMIDGGGLGEPVPQWW